MSNPIYVANTANGYRYVLDGKVHENAIDAKLSSVKGMLKNTYNRPIVVLLNNSRIDVDAIHQHVLNHQNKPQKIIAPSIEEAAAGAVATPVEEPEQDKPSLEVDLVDEHGEVVETEPKVVNTLRNKQNGDPRNSKAAQAYAEKQKANEPVQTADEATKTNVKSSKTSKMKKRKQRGRKARQKIRKGAQVSLHYGISTPLQGIHTFNQGIIDVLQLGNNLFATGIAWLDMKNNYLEVTDEELQDAIAEFIKAEAGRTVPAETDEGYEKWMKARTFEAWILKVKDRSDANLQKVANITKAPYDLYKGGKFMVQQAREMGKANLTTSNG